MSAYVRAAEIDDIVSAIRLHDDAAEIVIEPTTFVTRSVMEMLADAFPSSGVPAGVLGKAIAASAAGGTVGVGALSTFLAGIGVTTGQLWLAFAAVAVALLILVIMSHEIVIERLPDGTFRIVIRKRSFP